MAALAKRRYTLEEYLELEKHTKERYVYCGGEVVAMSGASLRHNRIVRKASIMASATPFCFCPTQKHLMPKRARSSMA